jgi:glutamate--cysteine ligase
LLSAATRAHLSFYGPLFQPLRWRAAQLLSPLFTAVFASSPLQDGGHEGTKSVRARARRIAEPTRTGFPAGYVQDPTGDPVEAYLDFGLGARVLGIPDGETWTPQPPGLTFARWMEEGVGGTYPDQQDWRVHLSTLLPEVVPNGGLELESADALPRAFWSVPLTLWTALLCDTQVVTEVIDTLEPTAERLDQRWDTASRGGLLDPELREQANWLFGRAADALLRLPETWLSEEMLGAFIAFGRRYAQRGFAPADEVLDLFLEHGRFGREEWVRLDTRLRRAAGTPEAGTPARRAAS